MPRPVDHQTQIEIEAAAFRTLRNHLMEERPDVQNIDLMNLAGFCRNCLARWMQEAAKARGIDLTKDQAREAFYGMPYETWREANQTAATETQQKAFETSFAENVTKKT
ncbi:DUF1244 domain-containing protein [Pseudooceanicola sp. C21-150M6]|uniref:DUF1244 domain-containing protein n=1 Tax=Pseudooceanicola sp. C21-150M6 TaxID=3434355 RepID=UPI003D7F84CE